MLRSLLILILCCTCEIIRAATFSCYGKMCPDTIQAVESDSGQVDAMDILRRVLKKKPDTVDASKKVLYSFVPAVGYTLSTGLTGILSANAAFYLGDRTSTNLSSVSSSFIYTQYRQITVPLLANIWTKDNRFNFNTDWRYFKYPQDTYGLGPDSRSEDADNLDYSHLRMHQTVTKRIGNAFYAGLGYALDYRWKVKQVGQNADVLAYGLAKESVASGPLLTFLYDNRKNSINPLKGTFASMRYRFAATSLGSTNSWQSVVLDIRQYVKVPGNSGNTLAFWSYNWLTTQGKPPYLDLPSTSWDATNNTGRGYIQGRFRGPDMLYLETEYRFGLTKNGLLGGVVFANAQAFSDWPERRFSSVAPGTGIGLRIKVNKQSRTNIAIDYGFGAKGSRGLFVNLGEVF